MAVESDGVRGQEGELYSAARPVSGNIREIRSSFKFRVGAAGNGFSMSGDDRILRGVLGSASHLGNMRHEVLAEPIEAEANPD